MTDKTANQVACFDKLNLVFIEVIALIIFNQHLEAGEEGREDKGGLNEASASALVPACFLLRNSASSFHWLSSSIFTVRWLLSRIGNTSSHPHYMMFQTIQTIYFL